MQARSDGVIQSRHIWRNGRQQISFGLRRSGDSSGCRHHVGYYNVKCFLAVEQSLGPDWTTTGFDLLCRGLFYGEVLAAYT